MNCKARQLKNCLLLQRFSENSRPVFVLEHEKCTSGCILFPKIIWVFHWFDDEEEGVLAILGSNTKNEFYMVIQIKNSIHVLDTLWFKLSGFKR